MMSLEKVASFFIINVLLRGFLETLFVCLTCLEDNKASDSGSVVSSGVVGAPRGPRGAACGGGGGIGRAIPAAHSLTAISPEI